MKPLYTQTKTMGRLSLNLAGSLLCHRPKAKQPSWKTLKPNNINYSVLAKSETNDMNTRFLRTGRIWGGNSPAAS